MNIQQLISDKAPLIMGIINCTPDSFFKESRKNLLEDALATAGKMVEQGVHILDIGGESSRPGSSYVSAEEEIQRVVPVISAIRREFQIPISVDTRKCSVASAAVDAGADIVNDISALQDDPALAVFLAEKNLPVILMHMKGKPENMQNDPFYDDVISSVKEELNAAVDRAFGAGIKKENIILDPGIGFGKRQKDNIDLLKGIPELKKLGYPLLIGLSRKQFLGNITGRKTEDRLAGTLAANAFAFLQGAHILRVHDVGETVDMVKVLREFL
jgi:dihydropteroate synthase